MPSLPRQRGLGRLVLVSLLALLVPWPAASAKEGDAGGGQDVRLFRIGALTGGRTIYLGERRPPVAPDGVSDETRPLFGGTAEEPEYPLGQVDEVIELIQDLMGPGVWKKEENGPYLIAQGEYAILARHRPEVLDEVARLLADLERRTLSTVTVELQSVRTSGVEAKDVDAAPNEAAPNEAAPEVGERGPLLALTGFLGQRVSGFAGAQEAYVIDYDVEVAKNAKISDPNVAVANLGLRADVRVLPSPDGRSFQADVRAWLAAVAEKPEVSTGEKRPVEAWGFDVTDVHAIIQAAPGVWTPLPARASEDGWSFRLRLTMHPWQAAAARASSLRLPAASSEPVRDVLHDVRDLAFPVASRYGVRVGLVPSDYTPPERPELAEPLAGMEPDALLSLLEHVAPKSFWSPGSLAPVGGAMLRVRNTPNVLAGVDRLLAAVRRERFVSIRTRADLIELPVALFERLRGADGVTPEGGAALERALKDGSAVRLERLVLSSRPAARGAVTAGRTVAYLADYNVEIAEGAAIANPVERNFLVGAQMEATAHVTGDGRGVALDVEFVRTEHDGAIRRVETPSGALMLPALGMFRLRGGLVVPVGRPVLFGAQGDGPMRRALLLTTHVVR